MENFGYTFLSATEASFSPWIHSSYGIWNFAVPNSSENKQLIIYNSSLSTRAVYYYPNEKRAEAIKMENEIGMPQATHIHTSIDLQEEQNMVYCAWSVVVTHMPNALIAVNTATFETKFLKLIAKNCKWLINTNNRMFVVYEKKTKKAFLWTQTTDVGVGFYNLDLSTGEFSPIDGFPYSLFSSNTKQILFYPYNGFIYALMGAGDHYEYDVAANKFQEVKFTDTKACGMGRDENTQFMSMTEVGPGMTLSYTGETLHAVLRDWKQKTLVAVSRVYGRFANHVTPHGIASGTGRIKETIHTLSYFTCYMSTYLPNGYLKYAVSMLDPATFLCDKLEDNEPVKKLIPASVIHEDKILDHMNQLFNNPENSDIVFEFENGTKVYAHSAILKMEKCDFITNMIEGAGELPTPATTTMNEFGGSNKIVIHAEKLGINGMTADNLSALLKFVYTRDLRSSEYMIPKDLSVENLCAFYNLARFFGIKEAMTNVFIRLVGYTRTAEDFLLAIEKAGEMGASRLVNFLVRAASYWHKEKFNPFAEESSLRAVAELYLNGTEGRVWVSWSSLFMPSHDLRYCKVNFNSYELNSGVIAKAQSFPSTAVERLLNSHDWILNGDAVPSDELTLSFGDEIYSSNTVYYPQRALFDKGFSISFTVTGQGSCCAFLTSSSTACFVPFSAILGTASMKAGDHRFCFVPYQHEGKQIYICNDAVLTEEQANQIFTKVQQEETFIGINGRNVQISNIRLSLFNTSDSESLKAMEAASKRCEETTFLCDYWRYCNGTLSLVHNPVTCTRHLGTVREYTDINSEYEEYTEAEFMCCGKRRSTNSLCTVSSPHLLPCFCECNTQFDNQGIMSFTLFNKYRSRY